MRTTETPCHPERSEGSWHRERILRSAQDDTSRDEDDRRNIRSTRAARAALALVLLVALGVRLWGVGWQLPWQFHPDEGHYTWKALDLIGDDSLNPKYFRNPSLFTYLLYGQYRLLGFQPPKADETTADGLLRPPSGVAIVGRLNSALLGWATVAAIGWLGWRLAGRWAGVASAAFLGLALIHVRDSHYATNDVPATLLLVLSVVASLQVLRHPTLRAYLLAGLLGGLATSTKYNAGLFFVPLVAAQVLAVTERAGPRQFPQNATALLGARSLPLLAAFGVAALAFLAGTPYALLEFGKFWADFRTQMRLGGDGWEGQVPSPSALLYLQALGQGLGWVMLALAVVGLVLLGRRRPRETVVLALFPLVYLLFMLRTELFFVRFALPVVPFLCLLAGCAIGILASPATDDRCLREAAVPGRYEAGTEARATGWAGLRRRSSVLAAALAIAALVQPAVDVARHDALVTHDDTRVLAARWALDNIPRDAKVALEEYTIRDRRPRAYGGPSWQLDTDLFNVNTVEAADPTRALRGPHRYFIVSSFQYERFRGDGPRLARQTAFYDALSREGRLVAEFSPGRDGTPLPFDLEDLYTPFWGLERYERPGPTIRIYEVGPGQS